MIQRVKNIFKNIVSRIKVWQWILLGVLILSYVSVWYIPYVQNKVHMAKTHFLDTTGLYVEHIVIEGRTHTQRSDIMNALGVGRAKTPIFSMQTANAQQQLEHLGWVKKATVARILPNTIYVDIQERIPVAILQRKDISVLIDMDGIEISDKNIDRFPDLKVVAGEDVKQFLPVFFEIIGSDETLAPVVMSGVYVSKRRWDIILKGNIRVQLPAKNPKQAWALLGKLAREKDFLARPMSVIDLRIEGRVNIQIQKKSKDKAI